MTLCNSMYTTLSLLLGDSQVVYFFEFHQSFNLTSIFTSPNLIPKIYQGIAYRCAA